MESAGSPTGTSEKDVWSQHLDTLRGHCESNWHHIIIMFPSVQTKKDNESLSGIFILCVFWESIFLMVLNQALFLCCRAPFLHLFLSFFLKTDFQSIWHDLSKEQRNLLFPNFQKVENQVTLTKSSLLFIFQIAERGRPCRKSTDLCDFPEFCNGSSEFCVPDTKAADLEPCNNKTAYCYGGICQDLDRQCMNIFGKCMRCTLFFGFGGMLL